MGSERQRQREPEGERDRLVRENLGLVYDLAGKLAKHGGRGPERSDLVSAGVVGLIQAAEGFDPGRGLAFSTLAVTRIRGAMLDEMRRWDEAPRSVRRKERQLRQAESELRARLEREPTQGELARALDISRDDLQAWLHDVNRCYTDSLDEPVSGQDSARGELRLQDLIPDDGVDFVARLGRDQTLEILRTTLLELPERERRVLALYYIEGLKLREIAQVFEVTESRISQIRHAALRALRSMILRAGVEGL